MSSARSERLVNLVLALLSTRQYLTAERIRDVVSGYTRSGSDAAFFRMFERDKAELRDLGIRLETGRNSITDHVEGYRIARRDYELGEIDLAPDEAAAVALAARLWDSPELTGWARTALVKLRAAGVEVDENGTTFIEPRVHTEPAFTPLLTSLHESCPVRFSYRRAGSPEHRLRRVEPWGVVSWRSHWYVVGYDLDREAPRCFRLSRIIGPVHVTDAPGTVSRPADIDLLRFVVQTDEGDWFPQLTAKLWVADNRAIGLRRQATLLDRMTVDQQNGDVVEMAVHSWERAADQIAGHGPDVLVLEPDVLAKSVTDRLERIVRGGIGDRFG